MERESQLIKADNRRIPKKRPSKTAELNLGEFDRAGQGGPKFVGSLLQVNSGASSDSSMPGQI